MKRLSFLLIALMVVARVCLGADKIMLLPSPKYMNYTLENSDSVVWRTEFTFSGTSSEKYEEVMSEFAECEDTLQNAVLRVNCVLPGNKSKIRKVLRRCGLPAAIADSLGHQGFVMVWTARNVDVFALGERGILYGVEAVKQIVRECKQPQLLVVADWPDHPRRIFFDDISRGPIPTVSAIKREIRQLAELRYTALSFYVEHVVKTVAYPDFAPADGKLTIADIREISDYARKYQMEVIGSFQCFGHFESILSISKYASMGETTSMISPLDAGARTFLKRNLEELCDAFSSEYFNINCDETWDLDKGRNQAYVSRVGAPKFYADHIKFLYDVLKRKGKKTMMWGDMVMKYPEIIDSLPSDIVYLTWSYDGTNYEPWIVPFASRHRRFVVCPGIVNANRLMPDYAVLGENMQFIADGFRHSAFGAMLTEWDDSCMHNFASYSMGVAMAAEMMWNAGRPLSVTNFKLAYCMNRFGTDDVSYVSTIEGLMRLANLPTTFQMNSRILTDAIVPERGMSLNIDIGDLAQMRSVLQSADSSFQNIRFTRNGQDVAALRYVIDVYRFVCEAKNVAYTASQCYHNTIPDCDKRAGLIKNLESVLDLRSLLRSVVGQYSALWFAENQYYTYGHTLAIFNDRDVELSRMDSDLRNAIRLIDCGQPLASSAETCLNVRAVNSNYLATWLVCGPFTSGGLDVDYLSALGGETVAAPQPGLRFLYSGNSCKWTRIISPDAFVLNLGNSLESSGNSLCYAFAEIISPGDSVVTLLFGGSGENVVFLNGVQIFKSECDNAFTADKYAVRLHLKKGSNRLMVKSRQLVREWMVSARIDGVALKSHKQKYYLGN